MRQQHAPSSSEALEQSGRDGNSLNEAVGRRGKRVMHHREACCEAEGTRSTPYEYHRETSGRPSAAQRSGWRTVDGGS